MNDRVLRKFELTRAKGAKASALILCLFISLAGCTWSLDQREKTAKEVLVLFTYKGECETVCLSGDFNGWSATSHCLFREGERWEIRVKLSPGRYRYGFILDRDRWSPDPNGLVEEDDGFGKKNSVLIVE